MLCGCWLACFAAVAARRVCCVCLPGPVTAPPVQTSWQHTTLSPLRHTASDTIMDCDQLLVLSAGQLVEQGAPGGQGRGRGRGSVAEQGWVLCQVLKWSVQQLLNTLLCPLICRRAGADGRHLCPPGGGGPQRRRPPALAGVRASSVISTTSACALAAAFLSKAVMRAGQHPMHA